MRRFHLVAAAMVVAILAVGIGSAIADGSGDPTAVKDEGGKWFDKNGIPTFHISKKGVVDWYTFSGYRRYNSNCIVCHGPDGAGSTYAPALVNSLKALNYTQFFNTVVNGKKDVSTSSDEVMPAWGTNPNVMCYLDDIFVYLRARSDGALGRGRPKHVPKPESAIKAENSCMGTE